MVVSDLADIDAGLLDYEPSIFHYLEPPLASNPNGPAIIVAHQSSDHLVELIDRQSETHTDTTCLRWTYAEIHHAALKVVIGLHRQGIRSGSTIVTLIPNGIEWALLFWASILGKFSFSALDAGLLTQPRSLELGNVLKRLHPDIIVVVDKESANAVDTVFPGPTRSVRICLASHVQGTDWTSLRNHASHLDMTEAVRIEAEAKKDDLDRVQLISFTSGTTTGRPKGCPRTVRNMIHSIIAQNWGSNNDATSRNMLQTANFRIIAPIVSVGTWDKGGCVVMPGRAFSPSDMLEAIEKHGIRRIVLVPSMVHVLTAHPQFSKTDKTSLRTILIGGDMITEGLYRKTCAAFPNCEVINTHGSTEGGSAFIYDSAGSSALSPILFYANTAPLGKVNRGTRLRIADDYNRPVKRNEVGELHYCSSSFVTHYLDNEKPEDFYLDGHGTWFKSGDTGMIDGDGWVYILGRKKDIIKRAGVPITPAALESCLDAFLESQTSVVAIPHEQLGQEPFAVVQLLNGKSKLDVMTHVVALFGKDYALGGVATLEELGLQGFPINATGKIVKMELTGPVSKFVASMAMP